MYVIKNIFFTEFINTCEILHRLDIRYTKLIRLQASIPGAFGIFYTQYDPLLSEIKINNPPDAYISPIGQSSGLTDNQPILHDHDDDNHLQLCVPFTNGISIPLDFITRATFKDTFIEAQKIFLISRENPEIIRPISSGIQYLRGNKNILVAEGEDRLFIALEDDCILEVQRQAIYLKPVNRTKFDATIGTTLRVAASIPEAPSSADLFNCLSSLCQAPGEESVLRSHPFFRRPLEISTAANADYPTVQTGCRSAITFHIPPELRSLYAVAPLAFYTGASIDQGDSSAVSLAGQVFPLPEDAGALERWAGNMLRFAFHLDCAARYSRTTGKRVAGVDLTADIGLTPEKLYHMGTEERFLTYIERYNRGSIKQSHWHTASFIDPVPQSVILIPSLLHSLSAIYAPMGRKVTEREVVEMEVRQFNRGRHRSSSNDPNANGQIIMPELQKAFVHQWLSAGYPIDAIKLLKKPVACSLTSSRAGHIPRIAIICNEDTMIHEAKIISKTLKGLASIELMRNLESKEVLAVFSKGYEIVQFIGHSDNRGFKCNGGFADLSDLKENTTSVFFFNSCSSYQQGIKLLEKGSTCGISTLYKVTDDAALDVCLNFYKLIARGYPVLTSYLGARGCSIQGKEYLLLGNGLTSIFSDDSMESIVIPISSGTLYC